MGPFLIGFAGLVLLFFGVVLTLVATPPPKIDTPRDVFGMAAARPPVSPALPELGRYEARDGTHLAYRFYDSDAERILFFVHGSSYHGGAYHTFARTLSESGAAKVYLPNLRGHYMSGIRRGDVDYLGQLEDDLADLIALARDSGHAGPAFIAGHSSGGGLALRFAGGPHAALASGFALLSPVIPTAPSVKGGDAGGWASLNRRRLFGLLALNAVGIHGLDGLTIIQFNKPEALWDGTETLAYSYRLNASYHPRHRYAEDIAALPSPSAVLVGEDDEANDGEALERLFAEHAPHVDVIRLPGIDHFGVFQEPSAIEALRSWLSAQ
jgi:alpha-beta hydrolase superfamily lysophospholipase